MNKCSSCGFCCNYIKLLFPNHPQFIEWLEARGATVSIQEKGVEVMLRSTCPELISSGNKWICKIHQTKPDICRGAPCPKPDLSANPDFAHLVVEHEGQEETDLPHVECNCALG